MPIAAIAGENRQVCPVQRLGFFVDRRDRRLKSPYLACQISAIKFVGIRINRWRLNPIYTSKKIGTAPQNFEILVVPRPPREVVSALLKFRAPVPYNFWAHYVYTLKIGSAVPKSWRHRTEIVGCRADLFARINGVQIRRDRRI